MKISIKDRPMPVPLFYQPIFKEIMILAILKFGTNRNNKATINKIHLYSWALRDDRHYKVLNDIKNKKRTTLVPWAYEPAIEKILILAIVDKYCKKDTAGDKTYFVLTEEGDIFLAYVLRNNMFGSYIQRIKSLGNISEAALIKANNNWKNV